MGTYTPEYYGIKSYIHECQLFLYNMTTCSKHIYIYISTDTHGFCTLVVQGVELPDADGANTAQEIDALKQDVQDKAKEIKRLTSLLEAVDEMAVGGGREDDESGYGEEQDLWARMEEVKDMKVKVEKEAEDRTMMAEMYQNEYSGTEPTESAMGALHSPLPSGAVEGGGGGEGGVGDVYDRDEEVKRLLEVRGETVEGGGEGRGTTSGTVEGGGEGRGTTSDTVEGPKLSIEFNPSSSEDHIVGASTGIVRNPPQNPSFPYRHEDSRAHTKGA